MKKLIIAYLFTITNVFAAPPTYFNGELQTNTYIQNIKAPNYQTTPLGGINRRLETGNLNELQNPSFEHTTVTTGWTISNATSSSSTTRIEGSKSLSLALTGALSLSQSSTINAAQKSGVQMVASIWVNSSDVSDLQLCSLKNGSEDKCTVTGGYVQGSGWRQLTVSFLGDSTSNGLKLKSTDTTGTVLVDQAYVGIGSPVVDFTPDMVYSAKLLQSSGAVSSENTDFISSCTSGVNPMVCTFVTNTFSVAPNCAAAPNYANVVVTAINAISATSVSIGFYSATTGASLTNGEGVIVCQKQGADYKTSKAYVASGSVALNTTVYSAQVSNTGVVSNENIDFINGNCSVSTATYTCNYISTLGLTVPMTCVATSGEAWNVAFGGTNTTSAFSFDTAGPSGAAAASNFRVMCQKQGADYQAAFNPVIVGSFQGYNETPGTSRVETFSVSYAGANAGASTATNCTTGTCDIDQIGNYVSKIEKTGAGAYNLVLNKTVSKLKCTANATNVGNAQVLVGEISCKSCSSVAFGMGTASDTEGTLFCQAIP